MNRGMGLCVESYMFNLSGIMPLWPVRAVRRAGRKLIMTMTYQYQVSLLTAVKRAFSQYYPARG